MSMLSPSDFIVVAQIGTVIFGTVLAAPLLSSLEATRRRAGFICMMVGSFSSLIATAMTGLWILVAANAFWTLSSMRGFWLLHCAMRREKNETLSPRAHEGSARVAPHAIKPATEFGDLF